MSANKDEVVMSMDEFQQIQNQLLTQKNARYEAESREKKATAGKYSQYAW